MSDYCKQCSMELFNKDNGELANLVTELDRVNKHSAMVLCEGCGFTCVDHEGKCIGNCTKDHANDWDESRVDVIGQNGNDGLHYEPVE